MVYYFLSRPKTPNKRSRIIDFYFFIDGIRHLWSVLKNQYPCDLFNAVELMNDYAAKYAHSTISNHF